jgi:CBS-domain-containing membrane protein
MKSMTSQLVVNGFWARLWSVLLTSLLLMCCEMAYRSFWLETTPLVRKSWI